MFGKPLPTERILSLLAAAPPRIAGATAGLTPAQLHAAPATGAWPVNDVLAHLRACAHVWGDCVERILAEDHPTIRAVSPRAYIKQTGYPAQPFAVAHAASTAQRAGLLSVLQPLSPEHWSRAATVTAVGKPLEKSVHYDAQRLAKHEREHVGQIERVAGVVRG